MSMKREPKPDPANPERTNPGYERSKVTHGHINGEPVVSIEASTLWEYERDQKLMAGKRGRG